MWEIGKFKIEIAEATEKQRSIIQNLARFYIYDLSEYQKRKCPDNGLFEDEDYTHFWKEPGHYPYLVKCQDEIAGFVLVEKGGSSAEIDYHIAEFFIVRKFRRQGISMFVAKEMFQKYSGNWEVMAMSRNKPAVKFWEKTIAEYTKGKYTKSSEFHNTDMEVIRFANNGLST